MDTDDDTDDITTQDIRDALARLVTEGLDEPYNVGENGGVLLGLAIVESRVQAEPDATEFQRFAAYAKALTSVLAEAVEDEEMTGKSRRVLISILPLEPDLVGASLKERRYEAGKNIRPGKTIKPGTIRTYYEPKALQRLARVLLRQELAFRKQAGASDMESRRGAGRSRSRE
jgi:hypothetical protein